MAPSARPLPNENVTRIQTVCDNVHLLTEKPSVYDCSIYYNFQQWMSWIPQR